MPTFNLLYFKNLLDLAFSKFFEKYNDKFIFQDGKYLLAQNVSEFKLTYEFRKIIIAVLKELVVQYDILHPQYFIIIGACAPSDNLLLDIKSNSYFPEKLNKLIQSKTKIKYVLKEKDIKIDIALFNKVCISLFDEFFAKGSVQKYFGKKCKNLIFLTHNRFDCYMLFKTIKSIYGSKNCINLYVKHFSEVKSPIVAVNDLIDIYVNNKLELNSNPIFKKACLEIKEYLKVKLLI